MHLLILLAMTALSPLPAQTDAYRLMVLGVAQDAGRPQAGCRKDCCRDIVGHPARHRSPAALAIVDTATGQRWLIDATPDLPRQLQRLDQRFPAATEPDLSGIFLTHAHIGHYTGLMHLGREAMGARSIPVYAMPRMRAFLEGNGPWDQLVRLGNIVLVDLSADADVALAADLRVSPFRVPHRDEYSETVGFRITGPRRTVLYIPDIDKWDRWETTLSAALADVDLAYLDGTFFDGDELPGRDMSEIPHPFIVETLALLADLPEAERTRVRFIHLNHTNPALDANSKARRTIEAAGCRVAVEGDIVEL